MSDALALWRDRRGRLSWLRVATLAVLLLPIVKLLVDYSWSGLGARPLNDVIHRTGWWALMFLLASLAVTPLRRSLRFARLFDVRRMIGVAAFCYAAAHLSLYTADQGFNLVKVATEIASRLYLLIGFVAWLGLLALAVTSNDAMVKRLGGVTWRRLHMATYAISVLALIHYFQQTKADVTVPTLYAGLFVWLIGYRVLARWLGEGALTPAGLLLLAIVAAALTFLGEAVGIAIAFRQPILPFASRILGSAFDFGIGIRPGWWVLAAGFAVVLVDLLGGWNERRRAAAPLEPARRRPAAVA